MRDRPFRDTAYDEPNSVPGQLLLANTLVTDRRLQEQYFLMSTVGYDHTARDGKIPKRSELVPLFDQFFKSTFVPPPDACQELFDRPSPQTPGEMDTPYTDKQYLFSRPTYLFIICF